MKLRYFQKGFNYGQDGPGNRLVYHLNGCNMRCPWCSNPEGMDIGGAGREEEVSSVARAVAKARPMFFEGGGLTLTGGEVTCQLEAAVQLLRRAREEGVNTCAETNAAHPRFYELLEVLDHLISDLKHPDSALHKRFTGMHNERIKENLRFAARSGKDMLVRVPLIHGVNDDEDALRGFASFFGEIAAGNVRFEILPYHEYGKDKWISTFGHYDMGDAFVTGERVRAFEDALRQAGAQVVRT